MNDSRIAVSIDVSQSNSPVQVMCKQGDTGRVLLISLTDGGYPYAISKDCYAVFTAVKPDGKIICNPCLIENGIIVYKFTAQTCACPGKMTAEIRLYGDDSKLLISASFQMIVDKTVYKDGDPVVSDSEVTLLTRLISETNALNQEIREGLDSGAFIGPQGPVGPQGVPGTVSFDELTEEQIASLRGGQGPKGEPGDSGVYIGTEPPVDQNVNVWIDPEGAGEFLSEIAQQAAEILQPEVSQIKDDLSDKLPKSPVNWEPWTDTEQEAARERIGIPGDYDLIEEIICDGKASIYNRDVEPDGNPYTFRSIYIELEIQPSNVYSAVFFRAYKDDGAAVLYDGIPTLSKSYTSYLFAGCDVHSGFYRGWMIGSNVAKSYQGGAANMRINKPEVVTSPIKRVMINHNGGVFFDGDKIRIYGVRA